MAGSRLKGVVAVIIFTFCGTAFGSLGRAVSIPPREHVQAEIAIPSTWQKIDIANTFTCYLPPDMKEADVQGVESYFREYRNANMQVQIMYEPYDHLAYEARHPAAAKDYQERRTKIGDQKACYYSYHHTVDGREEYLTELYIGDWADNQVVAVISVHGKDASVLTIAKQIFGSIVFHAKRGAH